MPRKNAEKRASQPNDGRGCESGNCPDKCNGAIAPRSDLFPIRDQSRNVSHSLADFAGHSVCGSLRQNCPHRNQKPLVSQSHMKHRTQRRHAKISENLRRVPPCVRFGSPQALLACVPDTSRAPGEQKDGQQRHKSTQSCTHQKGEADHRSCQRTRCGYASHYPSQSRKKQA